MKLNMAKAGIAYDGVSTDTKSGSAMSVKFHVRALPTLIITKGGNPLESFVGLLSVERLEKIKAKYK